MWPELFRIPILNIPVFGYGLMMVIGFLAAIELAKFLAKRVNIDGEIFVNAALIALVAGIAGARLSHVLENLGDYTRSDRSVLANLWDAVNIRSGGLTFYGGFILATPILIWYAIKKKVPVKLGMDIVAPCLMMGLAFGRIGCFMNGCCYGAECSAPWAVQFPYGSNTYVDQYEKGEVTPPPQLFVAGRDGHMRIATMEEANDNPQLKPIAAQNKALPVHPAQLYSSITAFLLCALLVAYFTVPHSAGQVFALMLIVEGFARYVLELVRVEPPVMHIGPYGMSLSMVLGLVFVVIGIPLWFIFGRLEPRAMPAAA